VAKYSGWWEASTQQVRALSMCVSKAHDSTSNGASSALSVVVNAQADAQWDVAGSRGWLKRISKLDAAE